RNRERKADGRSPPGPATPAAGSDHRPVRNHRAARDGDDAVADGVVGPFLVGHAPPVDEADVVADAAILVENGLLDHGVVADADVRYPPGLVAGALGVGFEAVGPVEHRVPNDGVSADARPDADHAALDAGAVLDDAAVADQGRLQRRDADARGR